MRNAFADELLKVAQQDPRLVFLSGDIGNRLFDEYKEQFPDRFYNCGVAEANMTGVAAGLALCGLRPITYTITPFVTTRCLEQIRVDICYHHVPVIIVGVGAGMSYASLGATHHACEDIAMLRSLPYMQVVCPGDPIEVRMALQAAAKSSEPTYIRMGKKGEPVVHTTTPDFQIGKAITLRPGKDICLLSTGNVLSLVLDTADQLAQQDLTVRVESFHTVKPLDTTRLQELFENYSLVVTVEEHSLIGGFGSAVAEWLVDQPRMAGRLLRVATPDTFFHVAGSQKYVRQQWGLTPEAISQKILAQWK